MSLTETIDHIHTETNKSFSKQIPNLQIALDSTSLGAFKTCSRLYYYNLVRGYAGLKTGDDTEENPHLKFGTLYHAASELYDHQRAQGADYDTALLAALRFVLDNTIDLETGHVWQSSEPTKTQATLIRTLILYFDRFRDDPLKTYILSNGKPAVELSFKFNLADLLTDDTDSYTAPSGEHYMLCGHLDRVVEWNDELWIVDKKTTKTILSDSYFANYNPDNQMSLYTLAGSVVLHTDVEGVIIDAAQIQVTGSRFMRRPISRTPAQLEEWLFDLKYWLRMLEAYARHNYWPMNDKSCGLYGGCKFRRVCGADPSVRDDLLDAFYTKRTWDPLTPR